MRWHIEHVSGRRAPDAMPFSEKGGLCGEKIARSAPNEPICRTLDGYCDKPFTPGANASTMAAWGKLCVKNQYFRQKI
jgi:hypothetical protein